MDVFRRPLYKTRLTHNLRGDLQKRDRVQFFFLSGLLDKRPPEWWHESLTSLCGRPAAENIGIF